MRVRFHPFLWSALWPIRAYIRHSPISRGKGLLVRFAILPILPKTPAVFFHDLPMGGVIKLQYREVLGQQALLAGQFEEREVATLCEYLNFGSMAIDVGANVGMFTVSLARAVGVEGRIFAFEPQPENIDRLREQISLNDLTNVEVFPKALGSRSELRTLHLGSDPAFHSILDVTERFKSGREITVEVVSLDQIWDARNRPDISVMKIDVEGAELEVLEGASRMIEKCRPVVLVEANTTESLSRLRAWFESRNYYATQPLGFALWNYLFLPSKDRNDLKA